jgi:hypothetical protein
MQNCLPGLSVFQRLENIHFKPPAKLWNEKMTFQSAISNTCVNCWVCFPAKINLRENVRSLWQRNPRNLIPAKIKPFKHFARIPTMKTQKSKNNPMLISPPPKLYFSQLPQVASVRCYIFIHSTRSLCRFSPLNYIFRSIFITKFIQSHGKSITRILYQYFTLNFQKLIRMPTLAGNTILVKNSESIFI